MVISIDKINRLKYFSGIDSDSIAGILPSFKSKSYSKGETIIAEGDMEPILQFVDAGAVKVFKTSSEGKEQIIEIVRPGQSFGDITLFSSVPSPYSAQALGINTDILWVHRDDLMPFMEKNWKAALNAFSVIAGQTRSLLLLVEDLSFKNVTGRVAKILLQNSTVGSGGYPRLTQFEMAAMAGTAREVVGRSLKNLEDSGAISLDRHKIIINNKEYLKQLAGVD